MDGEQETFTGAIARSEARLKDAATLLDMAESSTELATQRLLAGCALIHLSVAVEEEIVLCVRALLTWDRKGDRLLDGLERFRAFRDLSLKERMREAVRLVSHGRLRLRDAEESSEVRTLEAIPSFRNTLVHDGPDTSVDLLVKDGEVLMRGSDGEWLPFRWPSASDSWRLVSPAMVRSFLTAGRAFVEELKEIDLDEDEGQFNGAIMTTLAHPNPIVGPPA